MLAVALMFSAMGLAQAQKHCLIKVAKTEDSHRLEIKADCGSNPDRILFAEGLQNTLRDKLTVVGVIDYMTDRQWELFDIERTIKEPGTESEPPVYWTELLFRRKDL